MSGPDFDGKSFEDLTEDELRELDEYDWTAGQIMRAISMALNIGDMEAVALLMQRLALKDPAAANIILETVKYQARTVQS